MRNFATKSIVALTLGAVTMSSCIGSFGLTNKVLDWNKGLSSCKVLNEFVFLLISPAYAVCSIADLFVLNTIEQLINAIGLPKCQVCTHCFDGSSKFSLDEKADE